MLSCQSRHNGVNLRKKLFNFCLSVSSCMLCLQLTHNTKFITFCLASFVSLVSCLHLNSIVIAIPIMDLFLLFKCFHYMAIISILSCECAGFVSVWIQFMLQFLVPKSKNVDHQILLKMIENIFVRLNRWQWWKSSKKSEFVFFCYFIHRKARRNNMESEKPEDWKINLWLLNTDRHQMSTVYEFLKPENTTEYCWKNCLFLPKFKMNIFEVSSHRFS